MGLCKCPKKRVTNQFCFEHRVNVCEHCMVSNHTKCVVQSYLQWLQDSDYTPICELCTKELATEDCVRLVCYHVFHWGCLDAHARRLPATTAPAGYTCPGCQHALFPAANLVSPVADVLREKLSGVNWARAGLGLPLLSEDRELKPASEGRKLVTDGIGAMVGGQTQHSNHSSSNNLSSVNNTTRSAERAPSPHSVVHMDDSLSSYNYSVSGQTPRRIFEALDVSRDPLFDHDENKYKRRSAVDFMKRWWKTQGRRGGSGFYRRYWILGLVVMLAVFLLIYLFSWAGSIATANDPNLDPMLNPNIHVQNVD